MKNWVKKRLTFALIFIAMFASASCTAAQPRSEEPANKADSVQGLNYNSLKNISETLAGRLGDILEPHLPGASVEVLLAFALYIDDDQFRNTMNVTNPEGVQATRHEFFLLFDNIFPLDSGRSVMRAYETIVASAECESGKDKNPGCNLLEMAKDDLAIGKMPASMFRQGWPDWRPIGPVPENWADRDRTHWTHLKIESDAGFTVDTQYLYVELQRGWLSADFLRSSGWYINGKCSGFVSDGIPENDGKLGDKTEHEFLPRVPVGLLMTRDLHIKDVESGAELNLVPTYVVGWVHQSISESPRYSDPCKSSCPDYENIKQYCSVGN